MSSEYDHLTVSTYFSRVVSSKGSSGPVGQVISWLANDAQPASRFSEIVQEYGVQRAAWFRSQIVDLVLDFISELRAAAPLGDSDLVEVELLKAALHIKADEFTEFRSAEIAAVLNEEMDRALADGVLTDREDLQMVRLQIAFGLGYDDFLRLARASIERGIDALLERLSTPKMHPELAQDLAIKAAALEPLKRLAQKQQRTLGALY